MCGIVGVFFKKDCLAEDYKDKLNESLHKLAHRGPDGSGVYFDKNIGLGHVRLSIIDLSNAGAQPMVSSGETHVITFNGEVYNFRELSEDLAVENISYKSNTDTEIILEYFKLFGVSAFEKLNGMFAFSVLDKVNGKAYLVRDRFGIKPLYYRTDNDKIVFASEIKGVLTISESEGLNESALSEWSYYGNPLRGETLHKNIKQLLPGHYIEVDIDTLEFTERRYWCPELLHRSKPESQSEIIKKVNKLVEGAVCRQLVSDVPVGVFLSGGLDSSTITAFAARNYGKPINTFSVGFDFEHGVGELPKAALVAKEFQTNHHELRVSGYDIADTVQKMVYHHDSPFSDAANIPLYLLGQEVKDSVKVVLQGDGGDEIFGGYGRYATLSNRFLWRSFAPCVAKLHKTLGGSSSSFYSRQRYLNALANPNEAELMALLLTVEDKFHSPLNVFSQNLRQRIADVDPFSSYKDCNSRFSDEDMVQRMLFTDTQLILPNIFLEKVDRSTMAASIEVRVPLLDHLLTEYVMQLPSQLKVKHGEKKWLLKKAMENILPDSILYSKKTGFGVPYQLWLKGPLNELFHDKLSQLQARNCDVLNWVYIDRLMNENLTGHRDHSFMLWKVLNLMIWLSNNE